VAKGKKKEVRRQKYEDTEDGGRKRSEVADCLKGLLNAGKIILNIDYLYFL
jgi:hypothetical protein